MNQKSSAKTTTSSRPFIGLPLKGQQQVQEPTAFEAGTLLACGCVAMATHANAHDEFAPDHPSCVVHDCCKVVERPNLKGRLARCMNYGSTTRYRNAGPIYGGGDKLGLCENGGKGCRCEVPSSFDLPFFSYRGPGSPHSDEMCRCGYHAVAHLPLWEATLDIDREWYKVGRKIHHHTAREHASDKAAAMRKMEQVADHFRAMTADTYLGKDAQVYAVTVVRLHRVAKPPRYRVCETFTPVGDVVDQFACGCSGWD